MALTLPLLTRSLSKQQRQIVANIRELGGGALYDCEYDFTADNGRIPGWERRDPPPRMLSYILGKDFFNEVVYVQLVSPAFTDEVLVSLTKDLKTLHSLRHVAIGNTQLSGHGILSLAEVRQLDVLDIQEGTYSDTVIQTLRSALPKTQVRIVGTTGHLSTLAEDN